ncbi:hypothetical protein H310_00680 [Aphanomyces invadans]|uniref:Centrosomal protein of 19 kDa n=1 Tax=Aphanomyces invadans TaxID=157072 RepID=A0A024UVI0_9STRA|nr:hypothetical protein H310_00680 [Aphanomyces invadans]ETW10359.1 hypothetical protein H310_00680 [Aphanomyces invadans]|eukprot:XP_008861770.1 hypothetical protein H310_00680 [Aphanomyces invadans]
MEPQRMGIRYKPPLVSVEFKCGGKLYLHEIAMDKYLSNHSDVAGIVRAVQLDHAAYVDDVSTAQLTRLVQKLFQKVKPLASLPAADYNNVSDAQLQLVKEKMDSVFLSNVLKPGDPGYVYDKQMEFHPTETSDWDD